jgi:tryptophan synthase alpha subunit
VFQETVSCIWVANQTGGALLPVHHIQAAVNAITAVRPDAAILCGFGIRDASDVENIRRVRGVHGVAIGSEAMRRLQMGVDHFDAWLAEVSRASTRST